MTAFHQKIRAGRALLGWNQEELGRRAGISDVSVSDIERGKSSPNQQTAANLEGALNQAGVVLTEDGVALRKRFITTIQGPEWCRELLEDVERTIAESDDKEVLEFGVDERVSSPRVAEQLRVLGEAGVRFRMFVREGDTYLPSDLDEYRYTPEKFFRNWLIVIYGDRVAIESFKDEEEEQKGCILVRDEQVAQVLRNLFEWVWATAEQPKERKL